MYHPSLARPDQLWHASFGQWFTRIQERLEEWLFTTRDSSSLSERIPFHELMFQCLTLRLNRPSPRCPAPTRKMRRKTLQASIALIKEFDTIDRMGKLFMMWHAAFFIVESGVCLLASILTELNFEFNYRSSSHLERQDVTVLICCIRRIPSLLRKMSRRWAEIGPHASALETVSHPILERLEQWSNGAVIWNNNFDALKQKLMLCSVFPPFPSPVESYVDTAEPATSTRVDSLPPPTYGNPLVTGIDHPHFEPTVVPHSSTAGMSIDVDWALPEWNFDPCTEITSDQHGFGVGDESRWDFSGVDYEQILAAMLEGDSDLMLNDVMSSSYC